MRFLNLLLWFRSYFFSGFSFLAALRRASFAWAHYGDLIDELEARQQQLKLAHLLGIQAQTLLEPHSINFISPLPAHGKLPPYNLAMAVSPSGEPERNLGSEAQTWEKMPKSPWSEQVFLPWI